MSYDSGYFMGCHKWQSRIADAITRARAYRKGLTDGPNEPSCPCQGEFCNGSPAGRRRTVSAVASTALAWLGGPPPLVHEAVELGGVLADDFVPGVSGQMAELLPDVFLRIRPDAVRVREVRGPHNVALADLLDELDADRVGLIGRIALAPPVFTRRHLELELFELILPLGIHAVEHVGDPADPSLADDDLEAGMALEHAAEDHR